MAAKKKSSSAKSSSSKSSSSKKSVSVKDLSPRKDPRGGSTDHGARGGKRNDY